MKIAVLIPCHDDTRAHFTLSLGPMLVHTMRASINYSGKPTRPDIELMMERTSMLPVSRSLLLKRAIEWGADFSL